MRKLRPYMTLASVLRYRAVLRRVRSGKARPNSQLVLRMKAPTRHAVRLREGWPDMDSFGEIFIRDVYRVVVDQMKDCHTIIDLGGNIGIAALYFAINFPQSKIVTVEPHPENFRLLEQNLKPLIVSGRCKPLQAAVWSSERKLVADSSNPPERYNAFAVRESQSGAGKGMEVSGLSMDGIIAQSGFDTIDLVKIDIEGAETALFAGALDWLAKVRALAIEFHGDSRRECRFDSILQQFEFRLAGDNDHTVFAIK